MRRTKRFVLDLSIDDEVTIDDGDGERPMHDYEMADVIFEVLVDLTWPSLVVSVDGVNPE